MTRPVRPSSPIQEVRANRKGVESLAKRPSPPLDLFPSDRLMEIFWGGPKWNWFINPPGNGLYEDFSAWTRDTSIDFGGYLGNGSGSDGDFFYIAAPLGPRWSVWHIDMCYRKGPDFGILWVEVGTLPFFRRCSGVADDPSTSGGNERFDIATPVSTGIRDHEIDWISPGWAVNGYADPASSNNYMSEVGQSFRITGEHGDMLTAVTTDDCSPQTGVSFNSGDGVVHYFRFFIDGKDDPSTGFKFQIQALRISRALEDDGTLI